MNYNPGQEYNHSRTIIHIDIDCFYAQVEILKNPLLKDVPLGIQQKNIVVTSNYLAREYGVKKCMLVSEARSLCPHLTLVNGEDLHDYRQTSYKITTHLQKYSTLVERLGLDENFVDVSDLVKERLSLKVPDVVGYVFGDESDVCQCGCYERLRMGTLIAKEMRDSIKKEFGLTTSAGIAHNKLLAKLVGGRHKPDQQTLVYPNCGLELVSSLEGISNLPGIGKATSETLQNQGIKTIDDLQNCDLNMLNTIFLSLDKAKLIYNLAQGNDFSPVKSTGKPLSIGLEDSCKTISIEAEVKDKIEQLLKRLMILVNEDGRIPRAIKLVVRKYNNEKRVSRRESKQCNINSTLFNFTAGIQLTETSEKKLMALIMNLFTKMVDIRRPYHITLLGLSFVKFQERAVGRNSIVNFLKKDVEVQTVTSIENKKDLSNSLMDYTNNSNLSDFNTDGSESEVEPSPKKKKYGLIARRRCFNKDYPSPSKLNVAQLRINSRDSPDSELRCPPNVDEAVFGELPRDMQEELWRDYKNRDVAMRAVKKPKINTLMNYFIKN